MTEEPDYARNRRIADRIYGMDPETPVSDEVVAVVLAIVGVVLIVGVAGLYGLWRWLR